MMRRLLSILFLSCAVQAADVVLGVHDGSTNYVKFAYAGANNRVALFGTWDLNVTTPVANTIMTLKVVAATNLYVLWGDGNVRS